MPSDRKQINVRADEETVALVAELIPVVSAALGLSVNQSDLFRLGLHELKKKYLTATPGPQTHAAPAANPKGRKDKA